jgi:hypothetical protein
MLYSLIHDQQLLLGPIKYNYQLINYDLEELEIEQRLTSKSFNQVPIQFDETTFLLPAKEIYPEYDSKYQKLSSPTWNIVTENDIPTEVVFTYNAVDRSLEEVKSEVKSLIAPERRNKENTEITLIIQGTEISVSTNRENRLSFASKLLSSPSPHNFKFGDETWIQITTTDLESIIQAIDVKVQEAFDWELAKIQEIDACGTIDEVYAVEIISQAVLEENGQNN